MVSSAIEHVSDTAFLIAHFRAVESARRDALFRDPLAETLSGERGRAIAAAWPTVAMTGWMTAVRTVVIDDYIKEAIARGVTTIVNLGAGLDTRPYRLDLPPALDWIEADYPEVIAFKEERLQGQIPRCRLERLGVDLSQADARRALLARLDASGKRMLVLTEGVVPYLDLEQASALATDLRRLRQVDGWIVDYVSPEGHQNRKRSGVQQHLQRSPFKFQPADWFAFFAGLGWRARETRYLPEIGERLGRPAPLPLAARLIIKLSRLLKPGAGATALRRFSGYVLLEPSAPSNP
ncbi:MAG TPA: SAM-dependent methyltransferase [Polyangia bacterium]|nr:SAM-dependent methyltransferase [Polyangia bacterium]